MGAEICRRFRFSNEETRQILALIENHMRFMDAQRMKESTLKRFFRLERFEEHLALHRMDCMAASGNLDHWEFVRERFVVDAGGGSAAAAADHGPGVDCGGI